MARILVGLTDKDLCISFPSFAGVVAVCLRLAPQGPRQVPETPSRMPRITFRRVLGVQSGAVSERKFSSRYILPTLRPHRRQWRGPGSQSVPLQCVGFESTGKTQHFGTHHKGTDLSQLCLGEAPPQLGYAEGKPGPSVVF